ncbi:NlpC/P60 family protein [Hoeflea marina]|uniref:NlpC/P60 family protein n=1 Tax=Hoeflea marina TaxID=274592 RepID=A0A317PJB8_9HYPH|nr:NlpC/P60 family protein [Hoeflea marina]PWW00394.1 NlpC/P60 family protein [Hoeflea marina]
MSDTLDHRVNAYRPDLADRRLAGRVEAGAFADGQAARIVVPVADLRRRPDLGSGIDTQALMGEDVRVFDRADGWAWVQLAADSYVGYLPEASLAGGAGTSTHLVTRQRSFVYPGPDLRFPVVHALSMASRITVIGEAETRGTRYLLLDDGTAVIAAHCRPLVDADPVTVAALMIETPYLWGGRSGFGIDCSGLVQLALGMAGKRAPRDSDQQAASLGEVIDPSRNGLRRGDLVFWKGHVAFLEDERTILHASGGTMTVTREPLADAIARIMPLYGEPTLYRRP